MCRGLAWRAPRVVASRRKYGELEGDAAAAVPKDASFPGTVLLEALRILSYVGYRCTRQTQLVTNGHLLRVQ